ncbi:hypothetical protein H9Y04_14995 [Streptomyces sp. TRM66268-LWL]|uniref:Uncharacterized protein n=1 Tax=Streptomyces polyasparticus TaxID=2767826 RepID=A0ABR7SGK7_9ACTN|nr:hypothetical protein [Streptomyces polyasparticus]MBC9713875.1 hypothetical protein [Streptomyces polyasparticus]
MTAIVLIGVAVLGAVLIFGTAPHVAGRALLIAGLVGLVASIDRRRHHR